MVSLVMAWMGLSAVALVALHWALDALQRRGRLQSGFWQRVHGSLEAWVSLFDADRRADRRRAQRIQRAQTTREAIARASAPMPLDPPAVEWDGNVARPRFGHKAQPHNLH